jgi:AcrR family transcriptional regulator
MTSEKVLRKREERRRAILDAAAARFATHGYLATRMADIAADLGYGKAALYYYFDSKEALLVELIEARIGVALAALDRIVASGLDAVAKVEAAVRTHLRIFHEHADIYTIFNSERLHLINLGTAAAVDELGRRYEALWQDMLSHPAFRADLDIPVTVKAIMGMLNTTLAWFDPKGRLDLDSLADRYVDLVGRMVLAD